MLAPPLGDSFYARINLYRQSMISYLRSDACIRLLVNMRGNIGDHLIWQGIRDPHRKH